MSSFVASRAAQHYCLFFFYGSGDHRDLHSFPTRRSSDLLWSSHPPGARPRFSLRGLVPRTGQHPQPGPDRSDPRDRSEEHTSELQSHSDLVCRLLLEKKKKKRKREDHLPNKNRYIAASRM